MAEVTINNSPVHTDTILTGVYGQTGSSWQTCGFHTGTDFAPYGSTPSINAPLYSVCNGTVVQKRYESALGNVVLIQDLGTGNYWRYCHMNSESPLMVGAIVTTGTIVRLYGTVWNGCSWRPFTFRVFINCILDLFNIFKSVNCIIDS